jgi:hypothetical protein
MLCSAGRSSRFCAVWSVSSFLADVQQLLQPSLLLSTLEMTQVFMYLVFQ